MTQTLVNLLSTYGYAVIFVVILLESMGLPLPGETVLVTAAAFTARGTLSLPIVIGVAVFAAILGDSGGYWIGRTGGIALVQRYGTALHIHASTLERAEQFFARHGPKTVFLGRFVALLRMWTAVLAGVTRMPYRVFAVYNVLGAVCWASLFGVLGAFFGAKLPALEHALGRAGLLIALLVVVLVGVTVAARWVHRHRMALRQGLIERWQPIATRYPRLNTFLHQRLAAHTYLGLHLTLGLLLSLGALGVFASLAEDVVEHDSLTTLDVQVATWLHTTARPSLITLARVVSWIGSEPVMIGLAILVALGLLWHRAWILLGGWVAAIGGAAVITVLLKTLFQRPRPTWATPFASESSWSFPSGHALGAVVAYGMLVYIVLALPTRPWLRRTIPWLLGILVVAIGLSRLYLGVHYLSDVLAGYAAGAVWLGTCITGCEIIRQYPLRMNAGDAPSTALGEG